MNVCKVSQSWDLHSFVFGFSLSEAFIYSLLTENLVSCGFYDKCGNSTVLH